MGAFFIIEKKYLKEFGWAGALFIAFLKQNDGEYLGSAKRMAKDIEVLSSTTIQKLEKEFVGLGFLEVRKEQYKNFQYILHEDLIKLHKTKEEKTNPKPKKELPANIKDLVDKIEKAKKEKRLKEICES